MIQKYYSIPEDDFEWLVRYGESLGHNKSSIVRVLIKERRALCEQERRDTGTTSLLKKPEQNRRDDDIENMPLYPIQ